MESIFFTVIDPISEGLETHFHITPNEDFVTIQGMSIDYQQLAELGMLLFALANQHGKPDLDSCSELLDGYEIPVPKAALQEVLQDA